MMKLARNIKEIPFDKNSVITVGTFDGVHLAHQKIISKVIDYARERNGRSVIVTFEPHPREVITAANDVKLLTTLEERQKLCEKAGIDWFVVIDFNKEFSQQSYRDFYVKHIINGIGVSLVVEGYDHHWGRNREGNIEILIQIGKEYGFDVAKVDQFKFKGVAVNSSMIRNELMNGNVGNASELLCRPYTLQGKVVEGDRRGRLLGYPTANIDVDSPKKLMPKDGIYFTKVIIDADSYFGMTSIGVRPTFQTDGKRTIEVNIFDFDKDIYGCDIQLGFLQRLRDELKFDSADQLVKQMHQDKELSLKLQYDYQSKE